jgi:glycosyltransferase involved in cell wall biosynthesis
LNLLVKSSKNMPHCPRISVVTPSLNQGRFIERTIASVIAQEYPDFEHIVVDAMSTDETPAVLARYPHLQVLREPDRGQADAINKGFRRASGSIFCYLNADDTLMPGAFRRVAQETRPERGRHIVMGRCIFIDEHDRPTGLEHPSIFIDHNRVLQVWNIHCIPQPATFWTAEAWRRCGPMDENEQLTLDYDLMCRFSRHYRFHMIDQVLATYRRHPHSKSCATSPETIYAEATRVSRRYWGPWWGPRYWRLRLSLACSQYELASRRGPLAAAWLVRGSRARAVGCRWRSLAWRAGAAVLNPGAAWRRWLLFAVAPHLRPWLRGLPTPALTWKSQRLSPLTLAWRGFTDKHADGYVGPYFVAEFHVPGDGSRLELNGEVPLPGPLPEPLILNVIIAGHTAVQVPLTMGGPFTIHVPCVGLPAGLHKVQVMSNWFLAPDDYWANGDFRPVTFLLNGLCCREVGERKGQRAA